ncbi:MAG: hypothetical protein ABR589_10425, partial [Chthoniobacterales bacterium]
MKKSLLLLPALLAFSSATVWADALLLTVNATPYDRQMERIRPVLTTSAEGRNDQTSLGLVNAWMTD